MTWSNHKPPSGIPAKGANVWGAGWGPPNGTSEHHPGSVGRHGGRLPADPDMIAKRREDAVKMWEKRLQIIENEATPAAAALMGIEAVMDRAEGKVPQTINQRKITCLADLTDEELAALAADWEQRRSEG